MTHFCLLVSWTGDVSKDELNEIFNPLGAERVVMLKPEAGDDEQQQAQVIFQSQLEAQNALEETDGKIIRDSVLEIQIQDHILYLHPLDSKKLIVDGNTLESIHVNIQQLNSIAEEDKKNNLGELHFGQIQKIDEPNAGKITDMLLEHDIQDLIKQLEDPHELYIKNPFGQIPSYPFGGPGSQVYPNISTPNIGMNPQFPFPGPVPQIPPYKHNPNIGMHPQFQFPGPVQTSQIPQQFNPQILAQIAPDQQKQYIKDFLYAKISAIDEPNAGKITEMLLELDIVELINLLENDQLLCQKTSEAQKVLREAVDL
ncbi:MAG: hypothetical protein EZS28_029596 [Streblomastix strix]|uniref:PABC domain-containing protein n=1 Tax=Streblomastix strix TaxID=222440 RepID=A0A5J4UX41_9EUKA|nr:MAG: hypothetical protein EZS28_029596 [Streblomastix strix]